MNSLHTTSPKAPDRTEHTPENIPSAARCDLFLTNTNIVLEGGAMRGQFTAGVLDFLMERGVAFNRVVGTSAGALNGYNYLSGQIGRTCLVNTAFCDDPRYLSLRSFVKTGNAFGREFSFQEIPDRLVPFDYDAFNTSPMTLTVVSSDLELGEADYHECVDGRGCLPYLIASSSMPLVSKIIEVDGKKLLDGGTCDSVPINYSVSTGAAKHVVVLTQAPGYEKKPNKLMPLMRQQYADYPYYLERCEYRHYEYNRTYRAIERMHAAGEAFVIRPQVPVSISSMEKDADKLLDLYEQGYEQAALNWPALKTYLEIR
ncbi:patatin family protein [Adlercreutzia sp. ZJ138]|uniref:patatin-like phospholipase family protein n=1 Tax=Adlercreutzia sp. ZJ138 TaxID=2709405 RepID=UPI0013EB63DD|nr:patatin family protein [Adlercreutzia sp. ZJ138]